ncbi:MAG: hypothetical protein AOA65_0572 [Candidatus Bathyarchaeota archaeon BA1]|nr:MAG: hypothetical protein AOA65_0572 [Candidatus Bathyarchaeota archaeon BA1]
MALSIVIAFNVDFLLDEEGYHAAKPMKFTKDDATEVISFLLSTPVIAIFVITIFSVHSPIVRRS